MPKQASPSTKPPAKRASSARSVTSKRTTATRTKKKITTRTTMKRTTSKTKTTRASAARTNGTVTRKAPTRTIAQEKPVNRINIKLFTALFVAFGLVGGASATIGLSDAGAIDVPRTIGQKALSQEAAGDVAGSAATKALQAAAQTKTDLPNGGLVGRGNLITEQQKRAPAAASSVEPATTTAATTSTTSATTSPSVETAEDVTTSDQSDVSPDAALPDGSVESTVPAETT